MRALKYKRHNIRATHTQCFLHSVDILYARDKYGLVHFSNKARADKVDRNESLMLPGIMTTTIHGEDKAYSSMTRYESIIRNRNEKSACTTMNHSLTAHTSAAIATRMKKPKHNTKSSTQNAYHYHMDACDYGDSHLYTSCSQTSN